MKNINKKIIYTLGAGTILLSPVYTMVSCGAKSKPTPPKPTPPKPTPYTIDLSKMKNVNGLITEMDKEMNFISKESTSSIGNIGSANPDHIKKGYPLTKSQYIMMGSTIISDIPIILTYNGKSQTFTPKLHDYTVTVQNTINSMIENDWDPTHGAEQTTSMNKRGGAISIASVKSPNMAAYMGTLQLLTSIGAYGYLSLPDVAWTAYQNELNSWTDFIWSINISPVYKEWLKSLKVKYSVPNKGIPVKKTDKYQYNDKAIFNDPSTFDNAKPDPRGINFDEQKSALGLMLAGGKNVWKPKEVSNLEVQFAFRLQDLYGPKVINL